MLRKYFDKARRLKGNTGEQLLILCERRLDNVVRRAGYCKTRPQARQGIAHGHFLVNGKKMDRASYQVKAGDLITVKNRPNLINLYKELKEEVSSEQTGWIDFDGAFSRSSGANIAQLRRCLTAGRCRSSGGTDVSLSSR